MPAEHQQSLPFRDSFSEHSSHETSKQADSAFAELYDTKVDPLVRRILANKMRVSLRPTDDTQQNQDALELAGEVKLLLFAKFCRAGGEAADEGVRDLDAYVRTITNNVFNQYLRRKYPRRLSLKNQYRYLFTHHPSFTLWKNDEGRWVCARAGSRDNTIAPQPIAITDELRDSIRSQRARSAGAAKDIIEVASAIFRSRIAPVYLDDMVTAACEVMNIEEPVEVAEPENFSELSNTAGQPTALNSLEIEEFVRRLWTEIAGLPIRHRAALLLNFNDDTGESLITLLPVMRVASIRMIADSLAFDHYEFARIWNELPWEDNRIAAHLGVTRQQVINLRQSARQMLKRMLR
jgi:hypothetical protein